MNLKNERTFVMIKPDGVQRTLIGEIIHRFERTGLKLVAMKLAVPAEEKLWTHYNKDDAWYESKGAKTIKSREQSGLVIDKPAIEYGKDIVRALVTFMSSGPVIMMVWEGNQAVNIVKKLTGDTEPSTSAVGTIRGDYAIDSYLLANTDERAVRNLLHCSDQPAEAEREMKIWFQESEIVDYSLLGAGVIYDVSLDRILK